MKPTSRFFRNAPALLTSTLIIGSLAHAGTISWDGDTNTSWSTGTNWVGGIAPANSLFTDIALFDLASYPNQPDAGTTSINGISVGSSSAALTISGTSLSIGSGGITVAAGAGATTISAPITVGHDWQSWTNNSSNLLSVGSISRATGTGVNFTPGTGGINTTNTNTNGILGGWATVGTATGSGATADWATVDGSGNVSAYTGYTTVSTGSATSITLDGSQAALNYKAGNSPTAVGTAYTTTWSTSGGGIGTINSLVVVNDNSVSSGSTLSVGSGGLILNGISRWILNNGTGSTAGTGQLTSGLASGELFVNVVSSAADANNWRIWTNVVDNGGTAVSFVKTGAGDVGLMNSNSYTGGTYLNSGTLSIANSGSLGTGDLRMNGGALNIRYAGANVDLANNIVISGSNDIYLGVARNLSLNGTLSGSGQLNLGNSNHNSTIYLNGANTMTGGTITTANNTNSVRFASASAGNTNVAWVFNNTSANRNTLDFGTGTISFGSMTGAGRIDGNGAGLKTISAGALGLNDTFSGTINNGSGTLALTKVGSGTMTLGGANNYTGATIVNAGRLVLNSTGSINSASALTVANGAIFDVSAKDLYTMGSGGTTIHIGATTAGLFDGGNTSIFSIGNALALSFDTASLGASSYNLFDYANQIGDFSGITLTGSITGSLSLTDTDTWTGTAGGYDFSFSEATGVLTVVPEPSAALLGGLGMLALLRRRRTA